MREKLKILSEILKQKNTDIKERLERLEFGCWINNWVRDAIILWKDYDDEIGFNWRYRFIDDWENVFTDILFFKIIYGREPQYSDILEYLGDAYLDFESLNVWVEYNYDITNVPLSPWSLSDQSDSTLDKIISLCKNVWK